MGFADGELVESMVTAGTGLLVSFRNKSNIRIFCLETFHPLQDVNIASVIDKVVSGESEGQKSRSFGGNLLRVCRSKIK